ncbi:MAG: SIR2 family protein [Deltaproteobacteria bacterium]|nr:SIR2 family protein [Deltaproteobacteria bacterium]
MSYVQDPHKQIGYLQQCLSSDKKPLGLFMGAGCPMAIKPDGGNGLPLIPDIAGITKVVRNQLSTSEAHKTILETVEGHFKKDDRNDMNVEDMLSHIRALRAVAGKDKVRDLSAEELDKLDKEVCELILKLVDKVLPIETPYHRIAAWVDAIGRERPVEIFTTNYDLLMEQAFEYRRVPYFDGFAGACKPFFDLRAMEEDMLPPRWARLWKLHGSINWHQVVDKGVFRGTTNEEEGSKRVIHPSHLKYEESRRMPYLAMIDRLRAFLKQPTATLVLCGYSFRDQHINEVILQGLQSTQTAIAFALFFDNIDQYSQAVKLACERSNLSILARDGAVISGRINKWPEKGAENVDPD